MKVLYDHQIFTQQRFGGISRYFTELIPRVARREEHDVLLTMGLFVNQYGLERNPDVRRIASFKRPDIRGSRAAVIAASAVAFRIASRMLRADVYHPTYYGFLPAPRKAKRVVTMHDLTHELFPETLPKLSTSWVTRQKKRSAIEADCIIAVSYSTKRDLVRIFGLDPAKIVVIHLASSLTALSGQRTPEAAPNLLYVGSRAAYKNFGLLLQVLAEMREFTTEGKLYCFGGGPFTQEEAAAIRSLGLSKVVHYRSGSDSELAAAYRSATALVYPSKYEGFGIPVLEAMGLGCPVVASRASSIPEVAGEAALLFDPSDAEGLARHLSAITSDSTLRESLSKQGRERSAQFGWDRCAEETAGVYASVTA